jgi:hypothetical protein
MHVFRQVTFRAQCSDRELSLQRRLTGIQRKLREEIQREEVGGDKVANVAVYSRQVGGGDLVTEVKRELLYSTPTL